MLTIESDDDNGYWMLLDDGIGIAKSKSRNALVRIRDALNAIRETGLVGLTVEEDARERPRGVVLAIAGNDLIVRLSDNTLDSWCARDCLIVEPERPTTPTPWNDPAIGIFPAVDLLKRVLACRVATLGPELAAVAGDIEKFLKEREKAQPT